MAAGFARLATLTPRTLHSSAPVMRPACTRSESHPQTIAIPAAVVGFYPQTEPLCGLALESLGIPGFLGLFRGLRVPSHRLRFPPGGGDMDGDLPSVRFHVCMF